MWSRCLKSVVGGVLALGVTLALALPTPKDIEAAVAAGRYTQAETMLRDVLQDKPQSAKAHYELGQVLAHQQRYKEAHTELQKAKDLDPSLKFASSPEKFNTVLTQVNHLADPPSSSVVMAPSVAPGTHAAMSAASPPATAGGNFSLGYVWLVIAGLVAVGLWLRRSAAVNPAAVAGMPAAAPQAMPQRGFGAQFTPNASPSTYPPQSNLQSTGVGSTVAGAVVGGLAGVAAGYALSKALEGDHAAAPAPSAASVANNGGYVPFDTPVQPDLGTFDAGSGDGWGNADSGSSDDGW